MDDIFKSLALGGLGGLAGQASPELQGIAGGALMPQLLQGNMPGGAAGGFAGGFAAPMLQGSGGMAGMAQSMGGAQGQSAVPLPMLLGALRAGGMGG